MVSAGLVAPAPRTGATAAAPLQDLADRLLPQPQYVEATGDGVRLDGGWRFAVDTSDPAFAFAATWFNDKVKATAPLTLTVVDGGWTPAAPARRRGRPGAPPVRGEALARQGKALPNAMGAEGYVLAAAGGAAPEVVIAAQHRRRRLLRRRHAPAAGDGRRRCAGRLHRGLPEPGRARDLRARQRRLRLAERAQRLHRPAAGVHRLAGGAQAQHAVPGRQRRLLRADATWVDAYRELFAYARRASSSPCRASAPSARWRLSPSPCTRAGPSPTSRSPSAQTTWRCRTARSWTC